MFRLSAGHESYESKSSLPLHTGLRELAGVVKRADGGNIRGARRETRG